MDAFLAHRRLTAAATRTAQPIATLRHRHVSRRPLVLCGYHLAGDPGAPLAFLYGTDVNAPQVVVIGEPRNRDLRFRGLEALARGINTYVEGFGSRSIVLDRHGRPKVGRNGNVQRLAADAPQLIVPNIGTADWLAVVARSTVWLRTEGDYAVDPVLPRFGGHLTQLTGRRGIPGSSNVLAATELLDLHWTTGQTDFEDANLATLLSWVDPTWMDPSWLVSWQAPVDAVDAASMAELLPSAGPVADPTWDADDLEPLIAAFNDARRAERSTAVPLRALRDILTDAFAPAWTATWRAIELVDALPEAATVAARWKADRWAWTSHLNRVDADQAFFRRYRTAIQAARLLNASEDAAAGVEAAMALDDPMVMARHIAAGAAIEGTVIDRDDTHYLLSAKGRRNSRPIIELTPDDDVLLPVGTELTWASDTRIRGVIHRLPVNASNPVEVMVTAGMRTGALPGPGDHGCFTTLAPPERYPDTLPDTVPWTHVLPTPPEPESEIA